MSKAEPGSKIQFGRVLAHKTAAGSFNVGRPYLENVTVEAEVIEELKGPKLIVSTPFTSSLEFFDTHPLYHPK